MARAGMGWKQEGRKRKTKGGTDADTLDEHKIKQTPKYKMKSIIINKGFTSDLNWPRRLCVRHTRWRSECVAGHCFCHCSVFFLFWPRRLACAMCACVFLFFFLSLLLSTHFGESPVCENWFPPLFKKIW